MARGRKKKKQGNASAPSVAPQGGGDEDGEWVLVEPTQTATSPVGGANSSGKAKKQKNKKMKKKSEQEELRAPSPAKTGVAVPQQQQAKQEPSSTDNTEKQKKRGRRRRAAGVFLRCCGRLSPKQFVSVFLLGAITALSVWLYIDLIIVAEEASRIRPLTERAANAAAAAHHKAAEVALKAQLKAIQAAEELQHSLDNLSTYVEDMLSTNKTTIDPTRPGLTAKAEMSPHFPVIMIPGVVSTGLEIWNGRPCAMKHFRMRIWGTVTMMQKLLLDKQCWLDHVMLDKATGLDPEGIKLRAAYGLEAADYLFPGYWVWGKLIQNFADIGYDSNNLFMAAYDWRLSFKALQERDQYFTKLKHMIELAYRTSNYRKVVLLTHSMGSNVMMYFLNWVQADPITNGGLGGGESSEWINQHIETWVNIAGPLLGVPKALASLASGEMRDTAQLGALESYVMETFFSRRQRAEMLRSWGSIASMLPKGGDFIWGNSTFAPDGVVVKGNMVSFATDERMEAIEDELLRAELEKQESECISSSDCELSEAISHQSEEFANSTTETDITESAAREGLKRRKTKALLKKLGKKKHASPSPHALVRNVTMNGAIEWMIKVADDPYFERYIRSLYSYGAETDGRKLVGPREPKFWSNPLDTALPNAPNMSIYCLYGVGKGAERAYFYKHTDIADELQETVKEQDTFTKDWQHEARKAGEANGVDIEEEEGDVPFRISTNNEVNDPEHALVSGVQDSEGDGTVPLMSLGYMCVEGWTRTDYPYNPANIKVKTREYPHQPSSLLSDLRGGPGTADHVDIMGNYDMTIDILRIAANQADKVEERIVSPIKEYARGVDLRHSAL